MIYKKIEIALKLKGMTWGDLELILHQKKTNNLSRSIRDHSKIKDLEKIFDELDLKIVSKSEAD